MKRTSLQDIAFGTPGSKRPCQSEDTENAVTFLYLGVTRFLMVTVLTKLSVLPDEVKVNDVNTMIRDDQNKQKWEKYLKEVKEDNGRFFSFFSSCELYRNEGVTEDYFTLHRCEDLTYYLYCYKLYQRCNESKWRHWREVFVADPNSIDASNLKFSPCLEQHNCYLRLLPYFWDNSTLEGYLSQCTVEEETEMKSLLLSAKNNKETQGMFAYKEEFTEDGAKWDENVWSKRLGACIENYIVDSSYMVKYTGDQANKIYNNKLYYHRFHGAPDLTIRKCEREVATVVTGSTSSDDELNNNSQDTVVGSVEDSVKVEGKFRDNRLNMVILEKCGELLGNMHIMLVNKMLKTKRLKSKDVKKLEIVGMLVSRPSGIVLCRYEMPVLRSEDLHTGRNAKLMLKSKVSPILPGNICVSLRVLL